MTEIKISELSAGSHIKIFLPTHCIFIHTKYYNELIELVAHEIPFRGWKTFDSPDNGLPVSINLASMVSFALATPEDFEQFQAWHDEHWEDLLNPREKEF